MNQILSLNGMLEFADLQALQDSFARFAGVGAILVDSRGKALTRSSGLPQAPPADGTDEKIQRALYRKLCQENRIAKKPTVTTSPFTGLSTGAVPVFLGSAYLGSWVIGPMLLDVPDRGIILRAMLESGMETDQAENLLGSLPNLTWNKLDITFEFLQSLTASVLRMFKTHTDLRHDCGNPPSPITHEQP